MGVFNRTTDATIARQYRKNPSLADLLSLSEWSDKHDVMLLEDGISMGAAFELTPIATENRQAEAMQSWVTQLQGVLSKSIPLESQNPWIVQVYCQKELTLAPFLARIKAYAKEKNFAPIEPFQTEYYKLYERLFKLLTKPKGLFKDPITQINFRGGIRRTRVCIYRRQPEGAFSQSAREERLNQLNALMHTLQAQFKHLGIGMARMNAKRFHEWLFYWFNVNPKATDGDVDLYLQLNPYPKAEHRPLNFSFADSFLKGDYEVEGTQLTIDGKRSGFLSFGALDTDIPIGVVSAERKQSVGESTQLRYALFDKCPPGSIYTLQMVFEDKDVVIRHIEKHILKAAIGQAQEISEVVENANRALIEIKHNQHLLLKVSQGIYYRESDECPLELIEANLKSVFETYFNVLSPKQERFAIDAYFRALPFNFCERFDKRYGFKANYVYARDCAKLMPVYGRARGDSKYPLLPCLNREGEPFLFDFLNPEFKMSNSHLFVLGSTGAGKSVFLINLMVSLLANYRPHLVVIEVGQSFSRCARYLSHMGLKVQSATFDTQGTFRVNPYANWRSAYAKWQALNAEDKKDTARIKTHAKTLIEDIEATRTHKKTAQTDIHEGSKDTSTPDETDSLERDELNEMVIATRLMLTQGLVKEDLLISLTDMILIHEAVMAAMAHCADNDIDTLTVNHVADAFLRVGQLPEKSHHHKRCLEFSEKLTYYTTDIVRRNLIHGNAEPFQLDDVLHVDLGFMKEAGYEDLLNIVCMSLLSFILSMAEKNKNSHRPIVLILDEVHILLKSELFTAALVLALKIARKLGLWIWLATQNVGDFSGNACAKGLSIIENWVFLNTSQQELTQAKKFIQISDKATSQILGLTKASGLFTEGYLMGKQHEGIFRSIPPREILTMAMNEQTEKNLFDTFAKEHNLSEVQTIYQLAREFEKMSEAQLSKEAGFLW